MISRKQNFPYIVAMSLSVSGCELIGPKLHEKLPLEPVARIDLTEKTEIIYEELSNGGASNNDAQDTKAKLYPGSGQFIVPVRGTNSAIASGKGEYSLNFDETDLGEVVKVILGDILKGNYVLSPKVTGKVTLQTSRPLNRSELLPMLEMLLDINNAAMLYQQGAYQIKPKAEAIGGSAFSTYSKYRNKKTAGHQIKVIPVKNVAVTELSEIIKPLLRQKSILHVDSDRNMLLIAGTATELARAMEMVEVFDVDVMKGRSFGLFPIQNVDAAKIIEELEHVFNNKSTKQQGFFQFMAIERMNSILAITHQAKYLKDIERWVLRLDKANTSVGGGAIVYKVQHVNALELASTLNDIFSQSGKSTSPASVASGRKVVEVTNKKKKEVKKPKSNIKVNSSPSIADVGEVRIIADEVNNALIIVATAQDYAVVQQVIKQLDVMPLQVLIDATIIEVTLKDELKYGIKWFLTHNNMGQNIANSGGGAGSFFDDVAVAAAGAASGGFGYAFLSGSKDIGAVLSAAATDNTLNVISSPSLMVLNNQEASIQVGDEVPIRTNESTNTNGGAANPIQTSSIQQRKTGVKLKVKPRVNASGLVIMEIEQSVENVASGSVAGSAIDSPTISVREISSSVAVQSGETIILGGLIKENDEISKKGIPLLHKLPLIGPLFGETAKKNNKTELVILITPRVVNTRQDARLITNEFKRKLSGIYEEDLDRIYPPTQAIDYLERNHNSNRSVE